MLAEIEEQFKEETAQNSRQIIFPQKSQSFWKFDNFIKNDHPWLVQFIKLKSETVLFLTIYCWSESVSNKNKKFN